MKRGISLVTSLLMTVSLFGGSVASIAAADEPISAQGAAELKNSTLKLVDTSVINGAKKARVPVMLSCADMAGMEVYFKVKSNQDGEAQPKISGIIAATEKGIFEVAEEGKDPTERAFGWTVLKLKGEKFENSTIAYVEVELPETAVTGSTYTISVINNDWADSEKNGYSFSDDPSSDDDSDLSAIISVVDKTALEGFITSMNDASVYAGQTVSVPMYVKCPENIGAMVADYSVSGGAEIVGYDTKSTAFGGIYTPSDDFKTRIAWTILKTTGADVSSEGVFANVLVKIPDTAKAGDKFTVKLEGLETSNTAKELIEPEKYASAVLTVVDEAVKSDLTLEIASKDIKLSEASEAVALPVYISHDATLKGIAALYAQFEVTNKDGKKAEIVSIKNGADIPAKEFTPSTDQPMASWVRFNYGNTSFATDENGKRYELFVLSVKLPEDAAAGDVYNVNFVKGEDALSVADGNKTEIKPNTVDGKITIVNADDIVDGYSIEMTGKKVPATGKVITEKVPVYLKDGQLSTFEGTFKVSGGASIKSITSDYGISFDKDNNNRVIWKSEDGKDVSFDTNTPFAYVEIEIPAELSYGGKSFTVSVEDVASTNADGANVYPVTPYGKGTITLVASEDPNKPLVTLDIDEVVAPSRTCTVNVPVRVSAKLLKSIEGKFTYKANDGTDLSDSVKIKGYKYTREAGKDSYLTWSYGDATGMAWLISDSINGTITSTLDQEFIEIIFELNSVPESVDAINISFTDYSAGLHDENNNILGGEIIAEDGKITFAKESVTTNVSTPAVTGFTDVTTVTTSDSAVTTATSPVTTATSPVTTVTSPVTTVTSPVTTVTSPVTTVTSPVTTVTSPVSTVVTTPVTTVTTAGPVSVTTTASSPVSTVVTTPVTTVTTAGPVSVTTTTASSPVSTVVTTPVTTAGPVSVTTTTVSSPVTTAGPMPVTTTVSSPVSTVVTTPVKTDVTTTVSLPETTVVTTPVKTDVTTTVSLPETTVVTTPVKTDVTTTVSSVVTTSVTTTISEPVTTVVTTVTTPVTTEPKKEVRIPTPNNDLAEALKYGSDPAFYFSYEKDFRIKDKSSMIVELYEGENKIKDVDLIAEGYVTISGTPESNYDYANFKYKVPFKFNSEDGTVEGYDAQIVIDQIDKVFYTAYIGQRGDISLDHEVNTVDSTYAVEEYNSIRAGDGSQIGKYVDDADLPEGLFETVHEKDPASVAAEFAYFLGDCSIDNDEMHEIDTRDATYMVIFYNQIRSKLNDMANTDPDYSIKDMDIEALWIEIEGKE